MVNVLLDEAAQPSVRETILRLMDHAATADLAIANVRLAALDLGDTALRQLHCRILLSAIDCSFSTLEPDRERFVPVLDLARSGRLQVRCSGIARWTPDFSIYRQVGSDPRNIALLGGHYFRALFTHGSVFTAVLDGRAQVTRLERHFESLWEDAYDVLPVIIESLRDVLQRSPGDGASQGAADPGSLAGAATG